MKTLYLRAKNHMDPSWRRCFTDHFREPATGMIVRPYSDIEELQILEYMDFAELYGVKYEIEQSLVVKKFLERNPDQRERFKKLVKDGFIELAGGGETVIDYNLTSGESWVRDHLYSIKYYAEEFGIKPRYAITPDIFGLPCQLPQFFRSIGYDADILFDRVMLKNKPYWRGLDGTDIVLDNKWLDTPGPGLRTADTVQMQPCVVCRGEGCRACRGTGFDISYNMTRPDKTLRQGSYYGNTSAPELIDKLLESDSDVFYVLITTEEPLIGRHLFSELKKAGEERGVNVVYQTFEDNHDVWCAGQVERLRSGDYTEDEVDPRVEGNPVMSAVSSSRIRVKQENRELEQLLTECESLAVLARINGGWQEDRLPRRAYPARKIEALWNKMAFIQFHDCVPGTHCDASANELERYIREVRAGAMQIYHDAAQEIIRDLNVRIPDGFRAAVAFNPTETAMDFPTLYLTCPAGMGGANVYRGDGSKVDIVGFRTTAGMADNFTRVTLADCIQPFSCEVYYYEPSGNDTVTETRAGSAGMIENEYYRIEAGAGRITSIYDKKACRQIVKDGGLTLSHDDGNAWVRFTPDGNNIPLRANTVEADRSGGSSVMTLFGVYRSPENGIYKLDFKLKITLRPGEKLIRFSTRLDWHGRNTRVYAAFEPAFEHNGDLICEVPFGTLARAYRQPDETDTSDDWPTIGFAGVHGEDVNLAFIKGGLPGVSLKDGRILRMALMRSFTNGDGADPNNFYKTTDENGVHKAQFALASSTGVFADAAFAHVAAQYNAIGHTECLTESVNGSREAGSLVPGRPYMPENLRLSAFKWAEDGSCAVIRLWESAGMPAEFRAPAEVKLLKCNSLEEPETDSPADSYSFRPFELATFRVIPPSV